MKKCSKNLLGKTIWKFFVRTRTFQTVKNTLGYGSDSIINMCLLFQRESGCKTFIQTLIKTIFKTQPFKSQPHEMVTLTQFVRNLSCLGVFDHFVRLPLKELTRCILAGKNVFLLNTIPYTFAQLQKGGYKGGFLDGLIVKKKLWIHSNNCSRFPVMRKTKKMMLSRSRHLPAQS